MEGRSKRNWVGSRRVVDFPEAEEQNKNIINASGLARSMRAGQKDVFAALRHEIERLDGQFRPHQTVPFGLAEVDLRLPGGGLARGALHEVTEGGSAAEFSGAATLFTAGIAARLQGPVLWCLNRRDLFAPGLVQRRPPSGSGHLRGDLPRAGHSTHHGGGPAGEGSGGGRSARSRGSSLTASRRLQLAAEASGVPAFTLRRWWNVAEREATGLPSAASTRWRISPVVSHAPPAPGLSRFRWQVDLLRCRGGEPHSWILEACDEKGRLALPADLADRPDQAPGGAPPPDEPLVTVQSEGSRRLIGAVDHAAHALGLRRGANGRAWPGAGAGSPCRRCQACGG